MNRILYSCCIFYLSPDLGWFIKDRFPVGGNLTLTVSDTNMLPVSLYYSDHLTGIILVMQEQKSFYMAVYGFVPIPIPTIIQV